MDRRKHIHVEEFEVSQMRLFALLCTPSSICSWWGASSAIVIPEEGGIWVASWGDEDDADYIAHARIQVFDAPHRMVLDNYHYYAKSGPLPFEANFEVEFLVEGIGDAALLRVTQDGFPAGPEGDTFLKACEDGWVEAFAGIRRLVEVKGY